MICSLIPRRYSLYMLFSLFFFAFFTCLSTHNVSAVSDYSETVTSPSGTILQNCDLTCIKQYNYLVITHEVKVSNNFIPFKADFCHRTSSGGQSCGSAPFYLSPYSPYVAIDISGINSVFTTDGSFPSNLPVTFTLTESLSSGSAPSGSLSITENGTYDVSSYAEAVVDVPPVTATYHEDLENINHSITVCAAVILVLYFFFCIYRLIIKNSGVH